MEDEEAVAQATLNHLQRCADLLTGIPQCMISVNYSRQAITTYRSYQNKPVIKTSAIKGCKFCFTVSNDNQLTQCQTCKRRLEVKVQKAPEPIAMSSVDGKKKKKRKFKEENAGLVIPECVKRIDNGQSNAQPPPANERKKKENKDKLKFLLNKREDKKESKLQNFLKLL